MYIYDGKIYISKTHRFNHEYSRPQTTQILSFHLVTVHTLIKKKSERKKYNNKTSEITDTPLKHICGRKKLNLAKKCPNLLAKFQIQRRIEPIYIVINIFDSRHCLRFSVGWDPPLRFFTLKIRNVKSWQMS